MPFPSTRERFERLEEALQIAHQMWSGEVGSYEGEHYRLAETLNSPQALSEPQPPVMIGGMGEKRTLRLVAQYADACNLFAYGGSGLIRHKLDVLRGHCEDVGRDYEEIERTALGTVNLGDEGMSTGGSDRSLSGDERGRHSAPHLQHAERTRGKAARNLRGGDHPGRRRAVAYSRLNTPLDASTFYSALTRSMLDQGRNS